MKKAFAITLILLVSLVVYVVSTALFFPYNMSKSLMRFRLQFMVVDADSKPIQGAKIMQYDGKQILHEVASTDEGGRAEIPLTGYLRTSGLLFYHHHYAQNEFAEHCSIQKDGYEPLDVEFLREPIHWHEIGDIEVGRPNQTQKLMLKLRKKDG